MYIENGTTVHLVWKQVPEAELRAIFQHSHEAETFCRAAVVDLVEGTFLVAVNHYDGKMQCFYKPSANGDKP